jgi:hypothetical protein
MRLGKLYISNRWLVTVGLLVGAVLFYFLNPFGRPDDTVHELHFSPKFGQLHRELILSKSNIGSSYGRINTFLPRSVSVESKGKVRVYLLDLGPYRGTPEFVNAFMRASEEIQRGEEPSTSAVFAKAADVTEAHFDLPHWPWQWRTRWMLIVFSNEETTATVRISYGK